MRITQKINVIYVISSSLLPMDVLELKILLSVFFFTGIDKINTRSLYIDIKKYVLLYNSPWEPQI
jgi:hypothetical protein